MGIKLTDKFTPMLLMACTTPDGERIFFFEGQLINQCVEVAYLIEFEEDTIVVVHTYWSTLDQSRDIRYFSDITELVAEAKFRWVVT